MRREEFGLEGVDSNVEFGRGGPRITASAGVFSARNAANNAFACFQIRDASANQEAVNLGQLNNIRPIIWMHKITASEVLAAYFTLPSDPYQAGNVMAALVSGIIQINKQVIGSTGATPDFDILNTNRFYFNNDGAATGLSCDLTLDNILIIWYNC